MRENGLLSKNPLWADNGDGWADSMIVCRSSPALATMSDFFLRAYAPHKMKTTCSGFPATAAMTRSVKVSQPLP